jgi:hypothetical protein
MSADAQFAYYVYGITLAGVDWGEAPGLQDGEPVYAIPCDDLQAAVSRVPLAVFAPAAFAAKLDDAAWLQVQVLRHEGAVRRVFEQGTIIPMKFGTLFESEEGVRNLLAARGAELRALLTDLEGKQEWGVKIYADPNRLRQAIEEEDQDIRAQRAQLARKGAGTAYLMQQRLAERIAQRVEQARYDAADEAFARLSAGAVRGVLLRLLPPELTQRAQEMILNAAFLIAVDAAPQFLGIVSELNARHRWWQVEPSGPWAPYNFLTREAQHV